MVTPITRYQFIRFEQVPGKTKTWRCINIHHGDDLGEVVYYVGWRQYIYQPLCPAVYSVGCLTDIINFIEQLKAGEKVQK